MWRDIKILLIDDDQQRRHDMRVILDFLGEEVIVSDSQHWQQEVTQRTDDSHRISAVLIGDDSQGLFRTVITAVHQWDKAAPILCLGRDHGLDSLPDAVRRSVIATVESPPSYNSLLDSLHRCQLYREQYSQEEGRRERRDIQLFRSLVGTSRSIQQVRELIMQVADKDVSVLILGESGTGKEVVARNLHYHSSRRNKPFVPVNCGAIPAELLESELFGHEKGSFTGAIANRIGRFEMAEGGTLFLDEIGDMPLSMQVKMLRVLQEHTYERVGSNKTLETNVRIIAATHKNLEHMIEEGDFREDLYYRLNVFPIEMPSLRERVEDLPLLLNELIVRLENEKRGSIRFNSAAIMSLCRHEWHGNVRELANLVERLAILFPYGVIGVNELPKKLRHLDDEEVASLATTADTDPAQAEASMESTAVLPEDGLDLREYLSELESSLIQQALDDANGVVARAAEKLNIRRTTLVEKMRKYHLQRKEKECV
ncbi:MULTISPECIES: sigma-54 dependent transcriptional regulator [unclassified Oceanobacter]|jgi:sigma-54 specific flagellar transcriptional regulator A|uniref:sigma-54 dependent transcriptional regulator n=1 Tax=unclassified Oceanobacter TaxID=2620260 RepID=UPI0026E2E2F4|nr:MULTISPECIES: sigma-54 dependent transcriptional regulator [unclassified Oceanobacter]MDO6683679.1 sigma-54 dependent transcriptional regulator [Oceanobacter sp. 5_MG-2023]MDP2506249.1 sigma-54 dependent transcriptional regulator [Oceanobacter sp. 3_MG-2023]MDP2609818.1 sigma-54 dependent transcriptional regulator [Oceanobacter sp. 1_MG-2023]MDP2613149.1 sigma-54 dependent transcriptional regulator [Oceanobacter sp. 2_MG-2023]